MNIYQILALAVVLLSESSPAFSANVLYVDGKAPEAIKRLSTELDSHGSAPANRGSHGMVEYCYESNGYVVYSENLLGYGYTLSKEPLENLECAEPEVAISSSNRLGVHVGMQKKSVEELIGHGRLQCSQEIIWLSKTLINGVEYDVQTYVELSFEDDKLERISVFTTTTS